VVGSDDEDQDSVKTVLPLGKKEVECGFPCQFLLHDKEKKAFLKIRINSGDSISISKAEFFRQANPI
jgi:hypothetical protein